MQSGTNGLGITSAVSEVLLAVTAMAALTGCGSATTGAATSSTLTTCDEAHLTSAISSAQAGSTILFGCDGKITLTSTLVIDKRLTLDGGTHQVTLDGRGKVAVLQVNEGVRFTLSSLSVTDGWRAEHGGGLDNEGGTVTISNSTFAHNAATEAGGLFNNRGTVTISNSTFAHNSALGGGEGGLGNVDGKVTINDSTFAYNSAVEGGGGVGNANSDSVLSISNSTFAYNSIVQSGGVYGFGGGLDNEGGRVIIGNSTFAYNSATQGGGGGIFNGGLGGGTVAIGGTIVADNPGGNCLSGSSFAQLGYNLESGTDCHFGVAGGLQSADPKLASILANNGGPTQTIALEPGSPAIDRIPTSYMSPISSTPLCSATDQRGLTRPDGQEHQCDIGAYELQGS